MELKQFSSASPLFVGVVVFIADDDNDDITVVIVAVSSYTNERNGMLSHYIYIYFQSQSHYMSFAL